MQCVLLELIVVLREIFRYFDVSVRFKLIALDNPPKPIGTYASFRYFGFNKCINALGCKYPYRPLLK